MAVCRAGAAVECIPLFDYVAKLYKPKTRNLLPAPMFNVINGGKHASGGLACQEIIIQPAKAKTFSEALTHGAEVYHELKKAINKQFGGAYANVGDEGGFVPPVKTMADAFVLIERAINSLGYEKEFVIGIDAAASEFYENEKYSIDGKTLTPLQLQEYYLSLKEAHPLRSYEDPFDQDAFASFASFTKKTGVQVIGDDLLVTSPERIRKAVKEKSCNALLLKVNQIGTVTESLEAARVAHDAGWKVVVSHRSGEAEDAFIADFAVGIGAGQIKTGAPARGERTCKYNQLLRIEAHLAGKASYRSPYSD
jgi:enolase